MKPESIYQQYLLDEFEKRKSRNLAYSLRAYARDLEIPSPKLSQYLNGLCGISLSKASCLAKKLNLGSVETKLFTCSAEAAHARTPKARERAKFELESLLTHTFTEINIEKFNFIRDWYHLAILELTELSDFQSNSQWIASALDIPLDQVEAAIERLERLGLLKCEKTSWRQTEKDLETPPEFASRAIRDYHQQMIRLGADRIEKTDLSRRELGSVLMSVDKKLIPDLKKAVRKFQRDIAKIADSSSSKDALYAVNIQMIPIFEGENP